MTKTPATGFNLAEIKPVNVIEYEIIHPATGVPIGLKVYLQSVKSDAVRPVTRRVENERRKLTMRGKDFQPDDIRRNQIEIIAACITGWEWHTGLNWNGEELAFTPKNVKEVLQADWVRDQIDNELSDLAAFFPD